MVNVSHIQLYIKSYMKYIHHNFINQFYTQSRNEIMTNLQSFKTLFFLLVVIGANLKSPRRMIQISISKSVIFRNMLHI